MAQQRDSAIDEEPIFWSSTRQGFNDRDRMRVRLVDGKEVIEKHPQIGHVGDIKDRRRAPGSRFIYMVKHTGHEAPIVLTNAAADMRPNGEYGQLMIAKAKFYGWFPTGECPCALLATGRLKPNHIVAKSIIGEQPCKPGTFSRDEPCEHTKLEQAARLKATNERDAIRSARAKDPAQKMLEATQQQTTELVGAIKDALGGTPPKGKRKHEDNGDA